MVWPILYFVQWKSNQAIPYNKESFGQNRDNLVIIVLSKPTFLDPRPYSSQWYLHLQSQNKNKHVTAFTDVLILCIHLCYCLSCVFCQWSVHWAVHTYDEWSIEHIFTQIFKICWWCLLYFGLVIKIVWS